MDLLYKNKVDELLLSYLKKGTYTGCACGFSRLGKNGFEREQFFIGKKDADKDGSPVNKDTFFDVASLTKPLVTVLSLLSLLKEGNVDINDKLSKYFPKEQLSRDIKNITLKNLVTHTSGFPSHRPFYKILNKENIVKNKNQLIELILQENLECLPGEKYIYSDLDYMLLGYIIEKCSGKSLHQYWKEKITEPLNNSHKFYSYNFLDNENKTFAETGKCSWSGKKLNGIVNDDNCRAIGTLCGHTGLFSNLDGVFDICEFLLHIYLKKINNSEICTDTFDYFLRKKEKENWAYGFDVISGEKSSAGKFFSKRTIGHLGYTGTSFWIDLKRNIIIVLLTNRVIYGNNPLKIKEMRPKLHDLLMEYLIKNKD